MEISFNGSRVALSNESACDIIQYICDNHASTSWFAEHISPLIISNSIEPGEPTIPCFEDPSAWDDLIDDLTEDPDNITRAVVDGVHQMVRNELNDFSKHFIKQQNNSSLKGAAAEDIMEDILKERWKYTRTSGETRSADFSVFSVCNNQRFHTIIDIKNYGKIVPVAEYDKLLRDIQATEADGGILFIYSGYLAKRAKGLTVERLTLGNRSVVVAIVQCTTPDAIHHTLDLINAYYTLATASGSALQIADIEDMQYYLSETVSEINKLTDIKSDLEDTAATVMKSLTSAQIKIANIICRSTFYINHVMNTIDPADDNDHSTVLHVTSKEQLLVAAQQMLTSLGPRIASELEEVITSMYLSLVKRIPNLTIRKTTDQLALGPIVLILKPRTRVMTIQRKHLTGISEIIDLLPEDKKCSYINHTFTIALTRANLILISKVIKKITCNIGT